METRSLRANVIDRLALTMVTLSALAAALIVAGVLALAGTYPDADAAAMATLVAATPSSSESRTARQRGGGYIARAAPGMSLEEGFAADWRVHCRPTPGEVQFVDEPALFGDSSRDGMTPALSPEAVRVIIEGPAFTLRAPDFDVANRDEGTPLDFQNPNDYRPISPINTP